MNMSYCRFRNTVEDLRDCLEHINTPLDSIADRAEREAREELIGIIASFVEELELYNEGGDFLDADKLVEDYAKEGK